MKKDELKDNVKSMIKTMSEGDFVSHLGAVALFRHYSLFNRMSILLHKPDAMCVMGYKGWQKIGRYVKRDENGIPVLVPSTRKVYKNKDGKTIRRDTLKKLDIKKELADGNIIYAGKKKEFIVGYVFDITQTGGNPVPEILGGLRGDVKNVNFSKAIKVCKELTGYDIEVKKDVGMLGAKGYCDKENKKIVIRELEKGQMLKTLLHEVGHAMVANDKIKVGGRADEEIVAEGVAYTVCKGLGYDTSKYTLDYIKSWYRVAKDIEQDINIIVEISDKVLNVLVGEVQIRL